MREVTEWCYIFDNVSSIRSTYDTEMNRINKFLRPSSTRFFQSRNGDGNVNRNEIFDGTPERASDDLASSILNMLLSPLQDKFTLVPANTEDRENKIFRDQLVKAKHWICDHLSRSETCFMKAMSNVLPNIIDYGDGPFVMHRDIGKKLVKFAAFPKQEIYFQRNLYGEVINFFREVYMTPIQLITEFGNEPTRDKDAQYWSDLRTRLKTSPNDEHRVINIVYERETYDVKSRDPLTMKYGSIWIDYDKKKVLKESGFKYFPFHAPYWKLGPGEDYGRGVGHRALPDIITLNIMEKKNLAAAEVMITPPLLIPFDIMDDDIDLSPAAQNYINLSRAMFGTQFFKPEPLNTVQNLPISIEMQDRKRNQILLAFYNDLLEDDKRVEQSATESSSRRLDKVRKFTGPFSNLETDLLQAVIKEVYKAGIEFGEIEVDASLKDGINVAFTTAMFEAQQQIRLNALRQAADILTAFFAGGATVPGIKQDELPEYVFGAVGADSNLLESKEETRRKAEEKQQIEQDNIDASSFKDVASGLRDLRQTQI